VLPLTFISVFFNEQPSVRTGLRAALGRLPAILGWTLLAAAVGTLLDGLRQLRTSRWG